MICYKHGHIWLKNQGASPRYLICEIAGAGGDFEQEDGYIRLAPGQWPCVGGPNYQGGVPFGATGAAIRYLKRYFVVRACRGNRVWTDNAIRRL